MNYTYAPAICYQHLKTLLGVPYHHVTERALSRLCRVLLITLLPLSLIFTTRSAAQVDSSRSLVILHTGDLDGRLQPWDDEGADQTGGMARVVHLLRAAGPEALIVDTGDALGPALLSRYDGGRTMVRLMNRAGYSAMVPGSQDLSLSADSLRARAREAEFAMVAANLVQEESGQQVLSLFTIVERQGLRIAVTGLLSPDLFQLVHPDDRRGLKLISPTRGLRQVMDSLSTVASPPDVTVVLTHMSHVEVLKLARATEGVDLFIAGGYDGSPDPAPFLHVMQLGKGTRIVSMPGSGFVGHIDGHSVDGRLTMDYQFVTIDSTLSEDGDAARQIDALAQAFRASRATVVGTLDRPLQDAGKFIADLMRAGTGAEAAFINRGALRPMELPARVGQSTLDSLLRFDDDVVTVRLRGADLQRLRKESDSRQRSGQRLVFAGYDPNEGRINNRELKNNEWFRVATTGFLARGGEGYLREHEYVAQLGDRVRLRTLVQETVQAGGRLPGVNPDRGRTAWITRWRPRGTLSLTNTYERGAGEGGVKNSLAWIGVLETTSSHLTASHSLVFEYRTRFGQVRDGGGMRESTDRIDSKLTLTGLRKGLRPYASVGGNSEWTPNEGLDRALKLRGSSGLEADIGDGAIKFGLGIKRDVAAGDTQIGIAVVPEYKRDIFGLELKTEAEFLYATVTREFSMRNRNSLEVDLPGGMKLSVDGDVDFESNGNQGRRQLETELQIGLAIGFDWQGKISR